MPSVYLRVSTVLLSWWIFVSKWHRMPDWLLLTILNPAHICTYIVLLQKHTQVHTPCASCFATGMEGWWGPGVVCGATSLAPKYDANDQESKDGTKCIIVHTTTTLTILQWFTAKCSYTNSYTNRLWIHCISADIGHSYVIVFMDLKCCINYSTHTINTITS